MLLTVISLALSTGYFLLWQMVLLALPLIIFGFLWVYLGTVKLEVLPISLQERVQLGESLEVAAHIKNRSVLPKYMMKISQTATMPGYDLRLALNLPGKTSYLWRTSVNCDRRGRFSISRLYLEVGDPFGIFSRKRYFGGSQSVLVFPAVKELLLTPLFASNNAALGVPRWLNSHSCGDVYRVREYTEGDTLNRIHWRSTAHTGQIMVKDFSEESVRNVWILVDMSRESAKGNPNSDDIEKRITVAASLVKYYIAKGYPVGLISEGDKPLVIKSHPGEKHYWYIMEVLATLKAEGHSSIDEIASNEYRRLNKGSLVFFVTSIFDHRLLQQAQRLNNSGTQATFVIPSSTSQENQVFNDRLRKLIPHNVPAYIAE